MSEANLWKPIKLLLLLLFWKSSNKIVRKFEFFWNYNLLIINNKILPLAFLFICKYLIINCLYKMFPDAAYYANWLSILYGLKDRRLKNLLVFSPKIEDLTFLTLVYLKRREKEKNGSLLLRNLRFAKIRHIGDNFADSGCKMEGRFTDLQVDFCGFIRGWVMFCFELYFAQSSHIWLLIFFAAKRESL